MSQGKYRYTCPVCKEERSYTPTTLAKGVCRNQDCGAPFSPEQLKEIRNGIKNAAEGRIVTRISSRLRK